MSSGVFVGRDAELSQLLALARDAARGQGRSAVLAGEPGIGKSTLMDLVAAECGRLGMRLVRGVAEEMEQRLPFAAISSCLGIGPAAARAGRAPVTLPAPDGTATASTTSHEFAVTETILDLVEQWCAAGPVALLLDDLQWADPASLSVLHRLSRTAGQFPLLLLVACRPVPREEHLAGLLRSMEQQGSALIRLEPLDPAAVAGLVGHLTGAPPGPQLREMVCGAAGNPLYVNELVAALSRGGCIEVADHVAELATPARSPGRAAEPLPRTLPGTIVRRLDFLSPRARDVLQVAAVLGPPLTVTELSGILGDAPSGLVAVVGEAVAAGLLTDSGEHLVFRHDLIREALAGNMPGTARAALHLDAGRALAAGGAPVERVGQHLLASQAVEGWVESWVLDWLVGAADVLVTRAPAVAVDLLGRALAALDADDGRAAAVRSHLARALLWTGRPAEAVEVARAVLAAAHDPSGDGGVRWLLAQAFYQQGHLRDAQVVAEEALADGRLGPADAARFQHFAGLCRITRGRFDVAAEQAAAEAMVARGDPDATAYGLAYLSFVRWVQDRLAESLDLLDRAADAFGHRETRADWDTPVELYRGVILVDLDRYAEAETAFETGLRQAERHGSIYLTWFYVGKARLCYLAGRWDDAVAETRAGLDTLDTLGEVRGLHSEPGLRAQSALIAIHRGDMAVCEAVANAPYLPIRGTFYDHLIRWAQALAWEAQGQPAQALDALYEFWDQSAGRRMRMGAHVLGPDIARLAVLLGDEDRARQVAADTHELVVAHQTPTLRGLHMLCQGLAEADAGLLLEAADTFRAEGRAVFAGHAQENAAEVLARAGHQAEARVALTAALDTYEGLAATWDTARAKARLRQAGVRTRSPAATHRATSGWDALTETERKVAALVADGHSNPDVAARMFISRRTVQSHVSSILVKLGCTSRVELAVAVTRRGAP